jgi:hypothetical protein
MKDKRFYSPEIDRIIEWIGYRSSQAVISATMTNRTAQTLAVLRKIKPQIDVTDQVWTLWLRSERGDISAFGDFDELKEEGEVDSYEEFESRWQEEYPETVKWHQVTLLLNQDRLFFNVDSKCQFDVNFKTAEITGADVRHEDVSDFILWLVEGLEKEAKVFLKDPEAYNKFIAENLPLQKRVGKIKRMDLWQGVKDAIRPDQELGAENLKKFERAVNGLDESTIIEKMTANDFLWYCEIGYDANDYFSNEKKAKTPREKYEAMADLRHGGLLDIDPDSPEAFRKWYEGGSWAGTHPWEICRGGNTTHVSLQVARAGGGWKLYLDGFYRAVEVAKMAIALFEKGVPFVLNKKDEMLRMLKGEDEVGIVPEHVTPRYCHSLFPPEDRINDFLNPWHDPELAAVVKERATWYPVEALHPSVDKPQPNMFMQKTSSTG